jgi:uroporphyrinogen III methyltransferase/synthase
VLIPGSELSRDTVPVELRARGFDVTVVEAYRNVCPAEAGAQAQRIFQPPLPDWVLFASPSAVHNLISLIGPKPLNDIKFATIGSTTTEAVGAAGLKVRVEADPHTIHGLVQGVLKYHIRGG